MKKRILLLAGLIAAVAVLTGCMEYDQPITAESEGFWNQFIVYPLSQFIVWVAGIAGGSYGLSIIIVTIIIRFLILPLTIKQVKSSRAMQLIQPELQELQKKYSSKDQKTQQKLQEETMKLMQKHNVNPFAGCLPILIQLPILIGFYHAINRTREIANHTFLWFDLGSPDPLYILPFLAGITTFLTQKIAMRGTMNTANPQLQAQMKMMLYIMPVMIVFFAFALPSALSLYWVIGNIFSAIQSYFILRPEGNKEKETEKARGAKK